MAIKAKNSKKQQQTVTTAMVIPNSFVIPDEILGKISTAAASPLSDMDGNSSSTFHQAEKEIGHNCDSKKTTTITTESLSIIQRTQLKPLDNNTFRYYQQHYIN
ncbi:hypothetical protein G9A89_018658 [Geosiphon pyriformis]|nr:hypothetical protein G9A89_018658 [Geosiphon pyriformis]